MWVYGVWSLAISFLDLIRKQIYPQLWCRCCCRGLAFDVSVHNHISELQHFVDMAVVLITLLLLLVSALIKLASNESNIQPCMSYFHHHKHSFIFFLSNSMTLGKIGMETIHWRWHSENTMTASKLPDGFVEMGLQTYTSKPTEQPGMSNILFIICGIFVQNLYLP